MLWPSTRILKLKMDGSAVGRSVHGIKFKNAHGGKKDANVTVAQTWLSTVLVQLLEEYSPWNIYSANETGIIIVLCCIIIVLCCTRWFSVFLLKTFLKWTKKYGCCCQKKS